MKIVYDNIIFSLQRFGGISVVWNELLNRAEQDPELEITILDPSSRWMERYRDPLWNDTEKVLFHSSYFRIINQENVKNVTTVHDLTYHYYRSGLAKQVHLWQEARAVNHSAAILCVSEHTKKDLLSHYPKLDETHVHVVYNGVNEAFKKMDCLNLSPFETQGYLLYVGNRSASYKNWVSAVATAHLVGMPLVIVGGYLTPSEQALVDSQLGKDHYWVKTFPTQDELVALYNHAYCLLYPSAYEGFGLPIIEAQRTGCLVIGQQNSSVPEVMGEGGICVEANKDPMVIAHEMTQALSGMLNGTIQTDRLRELGLKNSQRFTWDKTYELTKQVYRLIDKD